ncbi:MAG: response regulator [Treponema sp.]|nr:response regulator [Treponema sp.]
MEKRGKKAILVVDDDIPTLTALRKILEGSYEVSLAKSASMAWSILSNTPIDLILLDFEMPLMSGIDFITYMQNNPIYQHIPVIFVTSHGTQSVFMKAVSSGAKSFVVKPVKPGVLLDKIRSVLDNTVLETEREKLLQKLHFLDIACKNGKSADAEKIADDLKKTRYNVGTDKILKEICKEVFQLNYSDVATKINELKKNNLFDRKVDD